MKPVVFKNARVIDPSRAVDEIGSVIVDGGKIIAAGKSAQNQGNPENCEIVDCQGLTVMPGLVDMRVFVGEPGAEHRETIASASRAAAAGGVTSFVMMPDTHPVIDDVALVEFVKRTACETSDVNIYPTASITKGFEGKEMSEFGLLHDMGAVAFTEGKKTLANASVMRRAMDYAHDFNVPILHETQDENLTGTGVMNEGLLASWLGLTGIPSEAEVISLERDLRLAQLTKVRYHASQLSSSLSVDAMQRAKDSNHNVSAGVSINHITLNENDIGEYRTFFRLSPPLRGEDDRLALIEALRNGTIDVVVSSHDPQDVDTKRLPFEEAEPGAIGLESLLAAALRLYHDNCLSLLRIVEILSTAPARLLGIDKGTLKAGADADMILVDLDEPWVLQPEKLHSLSKNTTFENARFQGRVKQTYVKGKKIFSSVGSTAE